MARRRCKKTGKIRYPTELETRVALATLTMRAGRIPTDESPVRRRYRAYRCIACGGWHATSLERLWDEF